MFTMTLGTGARRTAVLLVAAALSLATAAALGGPFAARAGSRAGTLQARSASCNAFEFRPIDTATGADFFGAKRIRAGTQGSGFFTCDPGLPDRAVVTKVQFSIWDGSGSSQVKYCGLYRSGLGESTSDVIQELAAMGPTGIAEAPGFARLTDTSIQNATVNTRSFVYWLQCNLEQAGQSLGLFGGNVVYTITAANG
jgi:hypothetical protein